MKKSTKIFVNVLILALMLMPILGFAQEEDMGLVTCTGQDCDFNAFMALINKVINYVLKYLVIPITAIMFAYAGFVMVTAGGESASAKTKAKNIFTNAVIGLILALGAWLIISTILYILGYDGSWIGLKIDI